MPRKKKKECKGIPGWLVSFGDLMSLLLTFFILLFSMGTISLEKFHMVIKGITESLGGRKIIHEEKILNTSNLEVEFPEMYLQLKKKRNKLHKDLNHLEQMLEKAGIDAEVEKHGTQVRFRLLTDRMFPPGSSTPYREVVPLILEVCKRLKETEFPVTIEGHTDNTPMVGKSNLELSAERALSVLKIFESCGYPDNLLSARGYGEYRPIAPNDTPENRSKNRRIEFVIDTSG
ncbi:OmpA/MotB family protein [Persephonella sp.]